MNALDYILLAILLLFVIFGYRRGFVWQALSIAGVIGAIFVAARYHASVAEMGILESIRSRSENAALVTAFVGIFILLTLITGFIVGKIGSRIQDKGLKSFDKTFGAVLGLAKGVLLLGGVAIAIQQFGLPEENALVSEDARQRSEGFVADSLLVPKLAEGCLVVIEMIPEPARDQLATQYKKTIGVVKGDTADKTTGGSNPLDNLKSGLTAGDPPTETKNDTGTAELAPGTSGLLGLGARRAIHREMEEAGATPTGATLEELEEATEAEKN